MIEEAMIIALKITLIFQATFIFYLFGKYEKNLGSARNVFFVLANAGCLFLASGSVIYAMHNSLQHLKDHNSDAQDMRNMGGLRDKMPITFWAMFISTLAISLNSFTRSPLKT